MNASTLINRNTTKLYYADAHLRSCSASILEISSKGVVLDRTVAFPEGGGQEGDKGILQLPTSDELAFSDTQKGYGRPLFLTGFPSIQVDTPIYHVITSEGGSMLEVGLPVTVRIDVGRRANLSLSHSASHLLYVGIKLVRPEAIANIVGCHIAEDRARFDFSGIERFSQNDTQSIEQIANEYVAADYDILNYRHKDESEAWYWECNGHIIPCGGTHLSKTGRIGQILVQRKGMGAGKERLAIRFPNARIDISQYYDE